jgi:hypothetical protein
MNESRSFVSPSKTDIAKLEEMTKKKVGDTSLKKGDIMSMKVSAKSSLATRS